MPVNVTRRTVLQKVRGCAHKALPQLVNTGFQVLFHSPPGVLFTFPSQYYALSVTEEYLALAVSYTHLDVYKRQPSMQRNQTDRRIASRNQHGNHQDVYKRQVLASPGARIFTV